MFYCRLPLSRPKSIRKMLIGRWKISTKRLAKVSRNQRRETAAGSELPVPQEHKSGSGKGIRNKKHKSVDRGKKDPLVQASPVQTKQHQEDADRVMTELLEEENKDVVTAATVSQKTKQAKKAGKERHRDTVDGQDGRGAKRRNTPRNRRIRRGQRPRLFLRRTRLRVFQRQW